MLLTPHGQIQMFVHFDFVVFLLSFVFTFRSLCPLLKLGFSRQSPLFIVRNPEWLVNRCLYHWLLPLCLKSCSRTKASGISTPLVPPLVFPAKEWYEVSTESLSFFIPPPGRRPGSEAGTRFNGSRTHRCHLLILLIPEYFYKKITFRSLESLKFRDCNLQSVSSVKLDFFHRHWMCQMLHLLFLFRRREGSKMCSRT